MGNIPLGKRGIFTIVDDEDFEYLSKWKWHALKNPFDYRVCRLDRKEDGEWGKMVLLHRIVINAPKGVEVDHINGDSLDNRKINLRLCTSAQNKYNRHKANSKTGYKGVYLSGFKKNKYYVQIMVDGKGIHLGMFNDLITAAEAYDKAAIKYFGSFAWTNLQINTKGGK